MKFTSCFFVYFAVLGGMVMHCRASGMDGGNDSLAESAVNRFQEYFNNGDSISLIAWALPQAKYDNLLAQIEANGSVCLTAFDRSYTTRRVVDEFNRSWQSADYKIDSITVRNMTPLSGCGGVMYRKIDARAFFRKGEAPFVELPLSLLLMAGESGEYYLVMQILNYKILQNEQ